MHVNSKSTISGMNQEFFCSIILFDSLNKENMNLNPFYHTNKLEKSGINICGGQLIPYVQIALEKAGPNI